MNTDITGSGEGIISALGQYGGASLIVMGMVFALFAFISWVVMKNHSEGHKELLSVNKEISKDFKTTIEKLSSDHTLERREMRQESREMQRENQAFLSDLVDKSKN